MFSAVVFTVRNSMEVLSVEAKGRDDKFDNSRLFSGFVTHHVSRWPAARLLRVRIVFFDQTAGTAHALLARASPKRRDGPEEEGPLLERHRRGGEARRWRHELLPGACPPGRVVRNVSPNPTHSTRFWHTPRDRGCRRVRHTSGIATPRARTPTRVVLTTQKRAGSEEVPCAWLGCCAPERAVNAKVLPLAGARESPPRVFLQ